MASPNKTTTSLALFFCLNLLFLSLVTTARGSCPPPVPSPAPSPNFSGSPGSSGSPGPSGSWGSPGPSGSGGSPGPSGSGGSPGPSGSGGSPGPSGSWGSPSPSGSGGSPGPSGSGGSPSPTGGANCPRDAAKIGVCVRVLNLLNLTIGKPPVTPCCTLIQGLVDIEAAACLCTAIKASILGIQINVPVILNLLLNDCGRNATRGFQCA